MTPDDRRGERTGWTFGWLGGFVWVAILSVIFLVQGKWAGAALGLVLLGLAVGSVLGFAPWRHPSTRYWKLMLPVYLCLAAGLVWLAWFWEGESGLQLNPWQLFLLGPVLLPFWTAGRRTWDSPGFERVGPGEPDR